MERAGFIEKEHYRLVVNKLIFITESFGFKNEDFGYKTESFGCKNESSGFRTGSFFVFSEFKAYR